MAEYRNAGARTVPAAGTRADIDQGLRSYMLKVYNLMAGGVALTGVAAYALYMLSFVTNDAGDVVGLTQLGNTLFNTPLKWVVMLELTRYRMSMPPSKSKSSWPVVRSSLYLLVTKGMRSSPSPCSKPFNP